MNPQTINISKLKNWDKNPRAIKKSDFERLKKQISELGQYKPLLITPDGTVLGGNMRLMAYKALGLTDIWVSIVEPKTEAEMVKYAMSDNDRAGFYIEQDLAELVQEYGAQIDLEQYKVDLGNAITLADLLNQYGPEVREDQAPPLKEGEPTSKLGVVYELGQHRLMCGDATKLEDVTKLLNGQTPKLVFTDPPYGISYLSGQPKKSWGDIKNDELVGDKLIEFLKSALGSYENMYVCCSWKCYSDFEKALGFPKNLIVWDKGSVGLGWGYRYQHEFIMFYGEIKKIGDETDLWQINRDATIKYTHPTQKPIALAARAIKNSSQMGDVVYDPFGGSGSTLIACEQLERACYTMELDPKYCDVIIARYNNFIAKTGGKQDE